MNLPHNDQHNVLRTAPEPAGEHPRHASPTSYLSQLDGIRFIAVGLVLIDHWLAEYNKLPLGPLGVTIFFVLSGFLISRILLNSKDKLAGKPGGLGKYLKTFYIRRTIRIFPIYYLCLLLLFIFNVPPVRETIAWCVLYATNIYIATKQTWMGSIDHFWSLAVEEQVYLVFPLLLFFIPRRRVPAVMVGMMVFSVALRYYFYRAQYPWMVSYVATPTCLDAFGLGALLAYGWLYRQELIRRLFSSSALVLVSLLLYVGVVIWSKTYPEVHNLATEVWERLAGSLLGVTLIGRAAIGFQGGMKWFLENRVSVYMGQISYGLYLFHNLVYNHYHTPPTHPTVKIWNRMADYLPFITDYYILKIFYFAALTVGVAALSWHFFEKPINALKERFDY